MNSSDFPLPRVRPLKKKLHEHYESLVACNPDATAIEWHNGSWTRSEVAARASAVAKALQTTGVQKGDVVAIHVPPAGDYLATVLAVIQIGGIYLPLDQRSPPAYLKRIVDHSGARLVVTTEEMIPQFSAAGLSTAGLLDIKTVDVNGDRPEFVETSPDDLMTLVYTSGSTGTPKGVARSHASMLMGCQAYVEGLRLSEKDRISHVLPQNGAAARTDLIAGMFTGGVLVMRDPVHESGQSLPDWVDEKRITVFHAVPTLFRGTMQAVEKNRVLSSVRVVRVGGEAVRKHDLELFNAHFSAGCVKMWSYSSSEMSLCTLARFQQGDAIPEGQLHSGDLLNDPELLILDENDHPVKNGITGQIVLKTTELSRGYWNAAELSESTYACCPDNPARRVFYTGDFGYIDRNGRLVMTGRRDFMVKVAGNRVDTDEVEDALVHHPAVREAAVAADKRTGSAVLVAWVVLTEKISPRELREYLGRRLPPYMIPPVIRIVSEMPLTTTQKLDRKSLLESLEELPTESEGDVFLNFVSDIRQVMREILKNECIGSDDNFFLNGGTSLEAIRLIERIQDLLGRSISPADLLDASTPRSLANLLLQKSRGKDTLHYFKAFEDAHSDTAIVCLPAGGRTVLSLEPLIRPLSRSHSVYLANPAGLAHGEIPHNRIDSMARDYARELLMARPRGSFVVCGRCIGGLVAVELTRQLEQAGRHVIAAVQLDTLHVPPPASPGHRIRFRFEVLRRIPGITNPISAVWRRLFRTQRVQRIQIGKHAAVASKFEKRIQEVSEKELELFEAHAEARAMYRSRPFEAKLVVVASTRRARYDELKRRVLWSMMARGGVRFIPMPGTHRDIMMGKNLRRVVKIIRRCATSPQISPHPR